MHALSKPVVIHIGFPKTGTKLLQRRVFSRHPDVAYVGKPDCFGDPVSTLFLRAIGLRDELRYRQEAARFEREAIRPLTARLAMHHGSAVVLSEEEWSTGYPEGRVDPIQIADRLHAVFPQARILAVVRNQEDILPSAYAYQASLGRTHRTWSEFLDVERRRHLGIGGLLSFFDYFPILEAYAERFGRERIRVIPHERLRRQPEAYLREVLEWVGVGPLPVRLDRRENGRPSRLSVLYGRARAQLPLLPSLSLGGPRWTPPSGEHRALARDLYAAHNAAMAEAYALPLAELGYPVA